MKRGFLSLIGMACVFFGFTLLLFAGPKPDPQSSAPSAVNTPQSFDAWWASDPACERMALVAHHTAESAYHAGYQAAQRRGTNKTLIPWLEINVPNADATRYWTEEDGAKPGMTVLDYGLAGLAHWLTATDQVIVTTRVNQVDYLYPALQSAIPDPQSVILIGGFKTQDRSLLPGMDPYDPATWDFADPAGWQRIAQAAQRVAELTGRRIVLLENEGALWHYHTGEKTINLARLTMALAPLRDSGLQIWWNLPAVVAPGDTFSDRRERTAQLTAAVAAAVPDSVFLCGCAMYPNWRADSDKTGRRDQMLNIVGTERFLDRLLLTAGGDYRRYSIEAAIVELWRLPEGPVIVYPGAKDWINTGEQCAALRTERSK